MPARNPQIEENAELRAISLLEKWFEEVSHVSKDDYRYPIDAYIYDSGKKFAVEIKSSTNNCFGITDHRYDRIVREIDCHFILLLLCPRGLMFYGEQVILNRIQDRGFCNRTYPKTMVQKPGDRELMKVFS